MSDKIEDIYEIVVRIRSLYNGCTGVECENCVLYGAEIDSLERELCIYLGKKDSTWL